jgi:stage IV sporulation protein FB
MNNTFRLGRIAGVTINVQILAPIFWVIVGMGFGRADLSMAIVGALVLGVAVLCHELGHALVARRLGMYVQEIELHPFGGVTRWSGRSGWRERFWITAAGPAVNLLIAAICYGLFRALPASALVGFVGGLLGSVLLLNLYLGIFNLLPIQPLDGGSMLYTVLSGKFGSRVASVTHLIGAVGGGALLLYGILPPAQFFLIILGGLFGWQNWQRWQAERPAGGLGGLFKEWRRDQRSEWLRSHRREIDELLRRSMAEGIHSLSSRERELLRKARQHDEWRN